ncbi:MAG: discoidin domain-containing protein [Candidatus Schekmanbacteria bacterium]|nr:discoidin domain-containing protein [Candidatus Schekmanbacteria bacterium]
MVTPMWRAVLSSPWPARAAALALSLVAAAAAFREDRVTFTLRARGELLALTANGVTIELGSLPKTTWLYLYNTGPNIPRAAPYLVREENLWAESLFLLRELDLDEKSLQKPLAIRREDLTAGARFYFWNPYHPAVDIRTDADQTLGQVRFRLYAHKLELQRHGTETAVDYDPGLGRVILGGLGGALFSAAALGLCLSLCLGPPRVPPLPRRAARFRWGGLARPQADPSPHSLPRSSGGRPGGMIGRKVLAALGRWQVVGAFAAGAAVVGWVHFSVFHALPGFGDEINYLVQARILAGGHLFLPEPQLAAFFRVSWMDLMAGDGRLWNFHPIGNSALLAAAYLLGSRSLGPILVAGGVTAALFGLARRLTGNAAFAWLAVAVLLSSQYAVTLLASFMAHGSALLFIELGTLCVVSLARSGREEWLIAAAACFGLAFLMRPMSAVLTAAVPAIWCLRSWRAGRFSHRTVAIAMAIGLAIASVELWRTWLTAGVFGLGYSAKGPEAGTTLAARWGHGWPWRFENLFMNYALYRQRIFGFGVAGNLLPVLLPLALMRQVLWLRLAYATMAVFWVVHSFLHWHGWMWEPRMLFEITHITVLLAALGLWVPFLLARGGRLRRLLGTAVGVALCTGFLLHNVVYDQRERLRSEYASYNGIDPELPALLRSQEIHDALLFYADVNKGFAQRLPDNEPRVDGDGKVSMDGDIVHAIHLGPSEDYALISRYPTRRVFRVTGQHELREIPSFYRDALPRLRDVLAKYGATHHRILALPWLKHADPAAHRGLEGVRLVDDGELMRVFAPDAALAPGLHLVVLVGAMAGHEALLRSVFADVRAIATGLEAFPLAVLEVDPRSRRPGVKRAGFQMHRYRGAACRNEPTAGAVVGVVELGEAVVSDTCVDWSAELQIGAPETVTFATTSDDGSGVVVDDRTVIDNRMFNSQGRTRKEGSIILEPGRHRLYVTYTQVSGESFFEAEVKRGAGAFAPLALGSFGLPTVTAAPDQVVNRRRLHGEDAIEMGRSVALAAPAANGKAGPIYVISDPGAEPGAIAVKLPGPLRVKESPLVHLAYRMAANTAYCMLLRVTGDAEGQWKTIPMRLEHDRRPSDMLIGSFNALQDGQWHAVELDLFRALGQRDVTVEEVVMGDWAGAATARLIELADIRFGSHVAVIEERNADNRVRVESGQVGAAPASGAPAPAGAAAAVTPDQREATPVGRVATAAPGTLAQMPRITPERFALAANRRTDAVGRMTDGDPTTLWQTGAPQQGDEWVRVTFPAPVELAGLRLRLAGAIQDYPRVLELSLSPDGEHFEPTGQVLGTGPDMELALSPPRRCRALRLEQKGADPIYWWTIGELEIFGMASATAAPAADVAADVAAAAPSPERPAPPAPAPPRNEEQASAPPREVPANAAPPAPAPQTPAAAAPAAPAPAPPAPAPQTPAAAAPAAPAPAAPAPAAPAGGAVPVAKEQLRVSSFRNDPYLEQQAIDGMPATRWNSGVPQLAGLWFQIDFPGPGDLARLDLHVLGAPLDYPRKLQVLTSADGVSWRTVKTVFGAAPLTSIAFDPPERCRAVKLIQVGSDPRYWWSINELDVLGRFPDRDLGPLESLPFLGLWLALATLAATVAAAMLVSRRQPRPPLPDAGSSPAATSWRRAAIGLCLAFAALLLAVQHQYGETWDEVDLSLNGQEYFRFLFGDHKIPDLYGHDARRYYGAFSDLLGAVSEEALSVRLGWMAAHDARYLHLLLLYALSGWLLFGVVGRDFGARAGFFCLVAYFAMPRLLGHAHNNPKDFPATVLMVIALMEFHAALRARGLARMTGAGIISGMALATKISAAFLAPIVGLLMTLFAVLGMSGEADDRGRRLRFAVPATLLYGTAALATTVVCWPWLWEHAAHRFIEMFVWFGNHPWNGNVLYEGRMASAHAMPWSYAPKYLVITLPLVWLPFAAAGLVRAGVEARRRQLLAVLVLAGFALPLLTRLVLRTPIYDGLRHILSVLPFLACLVGFGLDTVVARVGGEGRRRRIVAGLIPAAVLGVAVVSVARIHPYETTYFNALVGGGAGAMGRYELDYWGNSLQEAGAYVNTVAPVGSRVHVVLDLQRLARLRGDLVVTGDFPAFAIVLNRESLAPNPYAALAPAHEVKADGAVLSRVYDLRPAPPSVPPPAGGGR